MERFFDIQSGELLGAGTIIGDVLLGGTISGGTANAPGTLTIDGNYRQTMAAVYSVLIGSLGNSLLDISGSVLLDPGALLYITLLDGFLPTTGMSFIIMKYGDLSGMFTLVHPVISGNQHWAISYGGGDVRLTAMQVPEPGTMLLLVVGVLGLSAYKRRHKVHRR
jgi:hypothetical protein